MSEDQPAHASCPSRAGHVDGSGMPANPTDKMDRAIPAGGIGKHQVSLFRPGREHEELRRPNDSFSRRSNEISKCGVRSMHHPMRLDAESRRAVRINVWFHALASRQATDLPYELAVFVGDEPGTKSTFGLGGRATVDHDSLVFILDQKPSRGEAWGIHRSNAQQSKTNHQRFSSSPDSGFGLQSVCSPSVSTGTISRRALRASSGSFFGGGRARNCGSSARTRSSLSRKRLRRRCLASLALQSSSCRAGSLRRMIFSLSTLPFLIITLRTFPGFARYLAFLGRLELHAGSTRLGQSDCDCLLRRSCAMLSFTDVVHLFAHKLASLCRGRLSLAFILACLLKGLFVVFFPLHI